MNELLSLLLFRGVSAHFVSRNLGFMNFKG